MTNQRDKVIKALRHENPPSLPKGEIFIAGPFLDRFVPDRQGDYAGQLEAVARGLGLDVIGIDLAEEWSADLLGDGAYRRLGDYFTVGYLNGPFSLVAREVGFRKAVTSLRRDPAAFLGIAETLLLEVPERVAGAKQNDLSAVMIADDIAGTRGLLFSPDDFTETLLPVYKGLAQEIVSRGLQAFFHSDGDTRTIIGPLTEAGYGCFHPVDGTTGLDLYGLTEAFGERAAFMGHIDVLAWDGKRIARELSRAEESFPAGGLILGSACGLSIETAGTGFRALYPQLARAEDRR